MSWTDLTSAVNSLVTDTFGGSYMYQRKAGGAAFPVPAVEAESADGEAAAPGRWAHIEIARDVMPADPVKGDTLTIGSTTYIVSDVVITINGICKLKLQKT